MRFHVQIVSRDLLERRYITVQATDHEAAIAIALQGEPRGTVAIVDPALERLPPPIFGSRRFWLEIGAVVKRSRPFCHTQWAKRGRYVVSPEDDVGR